jgi:hypothetical protein
MDEPMPDQTVEPAPLNGSSETASVRPKQPFLRIWKDLWRDAKFFFPLGALFGVIQFISYTYFNKADWGSSLELESVGFYTFSYSFIVVTLPRFILREKEDLAGHPRIVASMRYITSRVLPIGTVAISSMAGFTCVAMFDAKPVHILLFVFFTLFIVGLSEIMVCMWHEDGPSRSCPYLLGVVIAVPWSVMRLHHH